MSPIREIDYFKAWLAVALVSTGASLVVGKFAGGVVGGVLYELQISAANHNVLLLTIGMGIGIIISFLCFRYFVRRLIVEKIVRSSSASELPSA